MTWMSEDEQAATLDPLATVLYEAADLSGNPAPYAALPASVQAMYRRMAYAAIAAADRGRLARESYASAAEVAAMPADTMRRLLDLMDARADDARDEWQER